MESRENAPIEIRRERGIYAVYVGGKHYASCDSQYEAEEEIAEIKESAPCRDGNPWGTAI